jgi:transcriptional regulator GlxA family with amidase domain
MRRQAIQVGIIGFEGANALDMVGPLEAFATAGRLDPTDKASRGLYETVLIGLTDKPFAAESGIRVVPDCRLNDAPWVDTLIVPGGWGLREPATCAAVSAWLRDRAPRTRRVASVCTGLYGLAPTGLLDGRRVTTHWRFVEDAARRFPRLNVLGDALFLKDGRYYTSGGITAGIDLSLALIEEDLGQRISLAVAREMVMYLKRAGGQGQYSEPLRFQTGSVDSFSDLIAWIYTHLDRDLSSEVLAARVRLSARHFSRRFTSAIGCTPAEFVETARLREARERLVETRKSIDSVAKSLGFRSSDVFRRRFERHFGIAPRNYRERFAAARPTIAPPSQSAAGTL